MSPGRYYNPEIEYVEKTEPMRGRPLLSAPIEVLVRDKDDDGEPRDRVAQVEFLRPKMGRGKKKGTESVRVKVGPATFSLAVITPTGSKESFLDAMFEDAEGFSIDFGSGVALPFLRIDMAARCGEEKALSAVAAMEFGLFFGRLVAAPPGGQPESR